MTPAGKRWIILAALVAVCLAAGGLGAAFTRPAVADWYRQLNRPAWTPPDWMFSPVWTALYVMMAVAAWLVWTRAAPGRRRAPLVLFAVQLALNAAWTPLFFGLRSPAAGLADIVLLWLAIGATTVSFFRVVVAAGWLMVPYWAWVTFAAALNFAIWRMNA